MSRRLTVMQVLPELNSGGVERGTLEIARALVSAGHRSIVVSQGGRMVRQLEAEGSEHITLPVHRKSWRSLLQIRPFRRLLADISPDIVHARSRIPAWIAFLSLRGMPADARPRFVTTVHGLYSVSPYSAVMTFGERVIVVSDTVREYVSKNYPRCDLNKVTRIFRGVSAEEFPYGYQPSSDWLGSWKAQFPELEGKKVLALPGRISRVKGHETFIRLMAALAPEHPDLHGLIVGGTDQGKTAYLSELKARIESAGLSDRITFTGHRSDMADVLTQADLVLALRTTPEAFGRSTLEPLRMGIPVIGWAVGGVGEILAAMYPQGSVPASDEAALLVRVQDWLAHPTRPLDQEAFPLSRMCSDTLAVYEEISISRRDAPQ